MKMNNVKDDRTHLIALGQAGFLIKSKNNQLLAIDPYLSDCVERIELDHVGYKRLLPKLFSPIEMKIDVLICTHFHRDHYDNDSVPILMRNKKTTLYCPKDCEKDVHEQNIDTNRVDIIKPKDNRINGDFTIHFIDCDHGTGAPYAIGVIVEVDGYRILEVGDTCLRLDRVNEYLSFGPIDILIGPINGMYGNMNEEDLVNLAKALNPKLTIPCHYGMFAAHHGDVGKFHDLMSNTNMKYLIMILGENYIIGGQG